MKVNMRQLLEKSCGSLSVDLRPPWEDMDARMEGATEEACKACATSLQTQGFLMSGWECYSDWFGGVHLRRKKNTYVTPVKVRQTFALANVTSGAGPIPVGKAPLPQNLRGVFWLSDQAKQSALITFAANGASDCQWCSYGNLILNRYLIRVDGDHTWSFATESSAGYDIVRAGSLIYDFAFNDATDPTHAIINPVLSNLGSFGTALAKQYWLVTFDMTLLSPAEAADMGFGGSVVWRRSSFIFGIEVKSSRYYVIQVVNELGAQIEPAWSKFVAYQNSPEAGGEPGILYYHGGANATARLYDAAQADAGAGEAQAGPFFKLLGAASAEHPGLLCAMLAASMILVSLATLVARRMRSATRTGYCKMTQESCDDYKSDSNLLE
jgi:hypothetical protein